MAKSLAPSPIESVIILSSNSHTIHTTLGFSVSLIQHTKIESILMKIFTNRKYKALLEFLYP